ncbi:MAG TPA: ABC transporter permease [Candidatus Kapabacteria bacterium]|nr:ABC transporter permease [Candidatus Kapabacteria bacterium]
MIFKIIIKNIFRHKLRTALTILGVAIAVMSFGLLSTIVTAWSAGSAASAPDRLITRQSVSFIFPLPLADKDQIARIPGVKEVSYSNWFGGIYIDKNQFFPRLAVDPETIFDVYPEYLVAPDEMAAFKRDRNSCIIGVKTAQKYNLKLGDIMPVTGDIYPGNWQFVVRGIYHGKEKTTDETQMFFRWDYLNEQILKSSPGRGNMVGWYIVKITNPVEAAQVSDAIDNLYKNSTFETKTETEKAFQQSFISMSSSLITSMQLISYLIIGIILLVLANTMVMTARERIREYAVLKTLGFTGQHLVMLIFGESLCIALLGGGLGILLTFPACVGFGTAMANFFPIFNIESQTLVIAASFAILVGFAAAIFPAIRALNIRIVDGLRQIG